MKVAVIDMRHLARSKFSRSLVRKKNFGLMWREVFKLDYLFVKVGRIAYWNLNELVVKSHGLQLSSVIL